MAEMPDHSRIKLTENGAEAPKPPRPPRQSPLLASPPKLLAIMVVWIFLGELSAMVALAHLPPLSVYVEAVVDALVLLLLLSPAYFLFYRPLVRLQEERSQTEREVRHLSRQLLRAAEEEKKRLARDLHDECGQSLTALHFMLDTLKTTLPTTLPKTNLAQVERIGDVVVHLSRELRTLTADLRPAMLDELGLVPALRWHVERYGQLLPNLCLTFETRGTAQRFSQEVEVALFRCCQEALNNVSKHSRARHARVLLEQEPQEVSLLVEDDGCGFDPQALRRNVPAAGGIGLPGMRERIVALGGWLSVDSAPGKGTRLYLVLPLERTSP